MFNLSTRANPLKAWENQQKVLIDKIKNIVTSISNFQRPINYHSPHLII